MDTLDVSKVTVSFELFSFIVLTEIFSITTWNLASDEPSNIKVASRLQPDSNQLEAHAFNLVEQVWIIIWKYVTFASYFINSFRNTAVWVLQRLTWHWHVITLSFLPKLFIKLTVWCQIWVSYILTQTLV